MSKSKPPPRGCTKDCCSSSSQSWMFIMKEFEIDGTDDTKKTEFVKLRHPRTDTACLFLFSPDNKIIQEVFSFSDKPRSFFIDNQVKSDGKIFISTPVDPLFLALPYLKKYDRCSPLDHIITDNEFPETERLLDCAGLKYIQCIADRKGDESLNAYIYNEEKTLKWLEKKVKRVASALQDQGMHVSSNNAISANFVVIQEKKEDSNEYLRYAMGMVSNYLPDSLTSLLETHLNLPPLESEKKRKSNTVENGVVTNNKKQKLEEEPQNGFSPTPAKEKKATPSAKAKAMAKAASGTKSITNFFKKK